MLSVIGILSNLKVLLVGVVGGLFVWLKVKDSKIKDLQNENLKKDVEISNIKEEMIKQKDEVKKQQIETEVKQIQQETEKKAEKKSNDAVKKIEELKDDEKTVITI